MEGQIAENPLGTQMLSRLLVRFAIPGMVPGKLFSTSRAPEKSFCARSLIRCGRVTRIIIESQLENEYEYM